MRTLISMKSLTLKFLAYAKKPKQEKPKQEKQEVTCERRYYPLSGFISSNETKDERMGRLVEAKAQGLFLLPEDYAYFLSNRKLCIANTNNGRNFKKTAHLYYVDQLKGDLRINSIRRATTQPILGGFR